MGLFSAFVVYLIVWWLCLFAVLPWGIRGQAEEDDVVEGTEPGAPIFTDVKRKAVITTVVATPIWALVCLMIIYGWVDWRNYPFLPDIPEY